MTQGNGDRHLKKFNNTLSLGLNNAKKNGYINQKNAKKIHLTGHSGGGDGDGKWSHFPPFNKKSLPLGD